MDKSIWYDHIYILRKLLLYLKNKDKKYLLKYKN